jgi:hypothetical protein
MAKEEMTVADIFRRAQQIRQENPNISYKEIRKVLAKEFKGSPFPATYNLTIPEQDSRAPEEDWSAGLPLIMRGIQMKDWSEIAAGIVLSLEQTENYEKARGRTTRDEWHDRTVGIEGSLNQGVGKWMPEELLSIAKRSIKE